MAKIAKLVAEKFFEKENQLPHVLKFGHLVAEIYFVGDIGLQQMLTA